MTATPGVLSHTASDSSASNVPAVDAPAGYVPVTGVRARPARRRFVLIGNPGSIRVEGFQRALESLNQEAAQLVTYTDLLCNRVRLDEVLRAGDIVRLESPGRDWEVEKALLGAGAEVTDRDDGGDPFDRLSRREIEALACDKGRLLPSRQWYLGWRTLLETIEKQLRRCPPHRVMNAPRDIAAMFDKPRCHERLLRAGVPVPAALGVPRCYEELAARMKTAGCRRVFVKLAHGSSGAGIVAFRTDGRQRHEAYTTTEVACQNGRPALYNSRRIRTLRGEAEIAELIDALCRHRVHVEEWLPKAGIRGGSFDLRVLVVAGQARHSVVRVSPTPITNLHLLNARADAESLRARIATEAWEQALASCREAVALYPGSLACGVDLMFTSGFGHHAVLELNAFGDLLPGLMHEGEDTYQLQARTLLESATLESATLERAELENSELESAA